MTHPTIVLIGSGNVATRLGESLYRSGVDIIGVYNRELTRAEVLAKHLQSIVIPSLTSLPKASCYLLAVTDSAIEQVSNAMPEVDGIVMHTSGTVPISALNKHQRAAVFYPLQTLSKLTEAHLKGASMLVETDRKDDMELLKKLATGLGAIPFEVSSEQRQWVHLAAVFANNFTNHFLGVAYEVLQTNGISFDLLKPLILETAQKAVNNPPFEVQTGPAMRNDMQTIEQHFRLLQAFPQYRQLYDMMSQNIRQVHHQQETSA